MRIHTLHRTRPHGPRGFTLVEAAYLMVFVSLAAVAVGVGLQKVVASPAANDEERAVAAEVCSEIEAYRGMTFTALSAYAAGSGTNTTDTVTLTVGGVSKIYTRNTVIQYMDPNNPATNASPQADFVSVQVSIKDRTACIWVAQP